jgi:alpha-D-ribose 1-methylphosphonate 5-triphosphate synthase subunit PhnI
MEIDSGWLTGTALVSSTSNNAERAAERERRGVGKSGYLGLTKPLSQMGLHLSPANYAIASLADSVGQLASCAMPKTGGDMLVACLIAVVYDTLGKSRALE